MEASGQARPFCKTCPRAGAGEGAAERAGAQAPARARARVLAPSGRLLCSHFLGSELNYCPIAARRQRNKLVTRLIGRLVFEVDNCQLPFVERVDIM